MQPGIGLIGNPRVGGPRQPPIDDPIIPRDPIENPRPTPLPIRPLPPPAPVTPPAPAPQPPPTRQPIGPEPRAPEPPAGPTPTPVPAPPINNPILPPGSVAQGVKLGVIAQVDNATSPQFVSVLIDNHTPPILCTLGNPWGPFAAGGTTGFNYFYNNSSGIGGSWCTVDVDNKIVVAISTNVSSSAPTPFYAAITDHKHTGGPNADGIQDPTPVNLAASESQNNLPYSQLPLVVQGVIDASGNVLSQEFHNGKLQSDGSITNVDGQTAYQSITLPANSVVTVNAIIAKGSAGSQAGFLIGTTTNGYQIVFDGSGNLVASKWISGTQTTLATKTAPITNDTNYHKIDVTISMGSTNIIEADIDGVYMNVPFPTDSTVTLPNPIGFTVYTGGSSGKLKNFLAKVGPEHYYRAPLPIKKVIDPNSNFLNVEFVGGLHQPDGSLTNIDQASSQQTYPASNNIPYTLVVDIAKGTATSTAGIWFGAGNPAGSGTGFSIEWRNGSWNVYKYISGTATALGTSQTLANDTAYHTFRLSVLLGSSTNVVECSLDNVYQTITDGSVPNGTYDIRLWTGGNSGLARHFSFTGTTHHYSYAPPSLRNIVDINSQGQQEDYNGMVELSPASGSVAPGYKYLTTTTEVICWDKSSISRNLSAGPIVYDLTSSLSGTSGVYTGWVFLANSTGGMSNRTLPAACYLVQWSETTIGIYKRASSSWGGAKVTATASNVRNQWDQNLRVVIDAPSSGVTRITVYASGMSLPALVWVDSSSPYTSGYDGIYLGGGNPASLFIKGYSATQSLAENTSLTASKPRKNLVVNGNNINGNGTLAPSAYGWTSVDNGASVSSAGTYTINGNAFTVMAVSGGTGNNGVYQIVPVQPGQTYTYCGLIYNSPSAGNGAALLRVYNTTAATAFNTIGSDVVPVGNIGSFYQNASLYKYGGGGSTSNGVWEFVCGVFTVPNTYSNARVELNTNSTNVSYFAGIMMHEGNVLQEYIDHEPNFGSVTFDKHVIGNLPISSSMNKNIPSLLPFTTDGIMTIASPSPGTSQSVSIDNGTSGTNCHLYLPDGSNQVGLALSRSTFTSVAASGAYTTATSAANGIKFTGETNGAQYYFMASWNNVTQLWTVAVSATNAVFTATQQISMYSDGGYLAFSGQSSGTVSTGGGGTITHNGCPEIHQKLPILRWDTEQIDYAEARTLRVKDFVLDPDGSWNIVYRTASDKAQIWEVEFDTETIRVDASHLFDTNGKGKWVNVKSLKSGDILTKYGGGGIIVKRVNCLGDGEFQHISCYRMRYVLGQTVSHNIKPL